MSRNHHHDWPTPYMYCDMQHTPHWPDACGHGGYIGSGTCTTGERIDVYIFPEFDHQGTCIRYGEGDGDYLSAGTPLDLLMSARAPCAHEPYKLAAYIIDTQTLCLFGKIDTKED